VSSAAAVTPATPSASHQTSVAPASTSSLPFTGVYLLPMVLLGLGLVGAGLVLIRRRRRIA
jgi:uncharacterized surface anchored protein